MSNEVQKLISLKITKYAYMCTCVDYTQYKLAYNNLTTSTISNRFNILLFVTVRFAMRCKHLKHLWSLSTSNTLTTV